MQSVLTVCSLPPSSLIRAMVVDELNALLRAKDELVNLMTHELRTPLLGIIGGQPRPARS